ncbi:hypothetical protein [Streptomyces sp. NPDC017949]|uniref:hypothetical protein n=1 Tax=Streptomyces sp. NPDC017949 TaxID=3365020 RepID=UPI0037B025A4
MSNLEPTAGTHNSNASLHQRHPGRAALDWANFGLASACVASGVAVGLLASIPLGIALVTAGGSMGAIKLIINVRR